MGLTRPTNRDPGTTATSVMLILLIGVICLIVYENIREYTGTRCWGMMEHLCLREHYCMSHTDVYECVVNKIRVCYVSTVVYTSVGCTRYLGAPRCVFFHSTLMKKHTRHLGIHHGGESPGVMADETIGVYGHPLGRTHHRAMPQRFYPQTSTPSRTDMDEAPDIVVRPQHYIMTRTHLHTPDTIHHTMARLPTRTRARSAVVSYLVTPTRRITNLDTSMAVPAIRRQDSMGAVVGGQ
jgi:hypothetical protein